MENPISRVQEWVSDIKTEYKRGKMIKNVAQQKADRRFVEKNGIEMTPRTRRQMSGGIINDKRIRDYDKDLADTTKGLKTKMKSKGVYKGLGKVAEKLLDA